tara:strand:- start:7657 stop:9288 length:1632 start_codon:yes stop_codon:yes gene_type:complete
MSLSQLSIKYRLIITSVVPLLFLIGFAFLSLKSLQGIESSAVSIYDSSVVPLRTLKTIADDYAVLIIDAVNKANTGIVTAEEAKENLEFAKGHIAKNWKIYKESELPEEELELAKEAEALFIPADKSVDDVIRKLGTMKGRVAYQLNDFDGPLYDTIDPISNKITELVEIQLNQASLERKTIADQYSSIQNLTVILNILVIIFMIAVNVFNYRAIQKSIKNLSGVLSDVSQNSNLTVKADTLCPYEISVMSVDLNDMLKQIHLIMTQINVASQNLKKTSDNIVAIGNDTADGIQDQLAKLDTIDVSINSLCDSAKEVSAHAENANNIASDALSEAEIGHEVVNESVESTQVLVQKVTEINNDIVTLSDEVESIESVISVINDIADQTNLLALNAAIEAARAGEKGRGFAVVADEVRTLANRTLNSTTEIRNSVQQVQQGTRKAVESIIESSRYANETGGKAQAASGVLNTIELAMKKINQGNKLIVTASSRQEDIIEETIKSLKNVHSSAQATSDQAEGLNKSSSDLLSLATDLRNMTGKFQV